MGNTIKIKRHRLVLDWFEIDDYEIDLDENPRFEIQCRGANLGDWYIIGYKRGDKGFLVQDTMLSFNLSKPWVSVYLLKDRILKFSTKKRNGFTRQLIKLMAAVDNYENSLIEEEARA